MEDFPFPRPSPRVEQSSSIANASSVGAASNDSMPSQNGSGPTEATAPSTAFALSATETDEGKTPGTKLRLEWQVVFAGDLEGLHHQRPSCTVTLVHAVLANRRSIFVDGEKVFDEAKQLKGKPFRHGITFKGHDFCIDVVRVREEASAGRRTVSSTDEVTFEYSLSVDGTAFSLLPTIDQLVREKNLQAERVARTAAGVAVAITDYFRNREGLLIHCRTERRPAVDDSAGAAAVSQLLPALSSPKATVTSDTSSSSGMKKRSAPQDAETQLVVEVAFRREAIETLLRVIHHRIQETEATASPDRRRRLGRQEDDKGDSLRGVYSFEAACAQLEQTTQQVVEAALLEMQRSDTTLCPGGDFTLDDGGGFGVAENSPARKSESTPDSEDTSTTEAVLESQRRGWELHFVFLSDAQNRARAKIVQCHGVAKRFGAPLFYDVAAEHGVGEDIAGPGACADDTWTHV